ncbi:lipase family protein [Mycobacterium sp. SMC-16]|uniref:lipase family protein n=1 Tax=Mycobacteriaceae TaxID=1762 RepID=UPI00076ACC4D|nr:lipase family protein [Mycolicibacterium mucogenicum]
MTARRMLRIAAVALAAVLTVAGCSDEAPGRGTQRSGQVLPGDYSGAGPGTLVAAQPLTTVDPELAGLTAISARITYVSTSGINDSHPKVTGSVFLPKGQPPEGGWRIIALANPGSGIKSDCAPSSSPSLLGLLPTVRLMVGAGYLVAITDYQGIGLDETYHPYLDSTTEGFNLIDLARATRKLVSAASTSWVAVGTGQGGQAAWAAAELATDYGGGLRPQGAVALAPTAALEWLADASAAGNLNRDQQLMLQQYLAIMPQAYPGFPIEDYRRGAARDHWDTLSACRGPAVADRTGVLDSLGPNDLGPTTPAAADALRGYLRKATLPQAPAAAPMLITPGAPDGLVPPEQTAAAVERACAMGDVIDYVQPDEADALGWITDRFNGVPAPNTCPGATPTSTTPTSTASSHSDDTDTEQSGSDTEEVTSTAEQTAAETEAPHHQQPAPPPPADLGDAE